LAARWSSLNLMVSVARVKRSETRGSLSIVPGLRFAPPGLLATGLLKRAIVRPHIDDKNDFDKLIKLADFHLRRWDARRSNEWKISLALWGLLLAGVYRLPPVKNTCGVATLLLIGILAYVLWEMSNLTKNDEDMKRAFYYKDKAESLLGKKTQCIFPKRMTVCDYINDRFCRERKKVGYLNALSPFFQLVATLIVAIVSAWMVYQLSSNR